MAGFSSKKKIKKIRELIHTKKPIGLTQESTISETIYIDLSKKNNIPKVLKRAAQKIDIIVILPENKIFNSQTARAILLNSYENKIGVIGFSKNMTKAGAVLSLHNNLEKMSEEAVTIVKNQEGYRSHSAHISISINKTVAKSLGISIK